MTGTRARPRIALYFRMFSPYILARIDAAAGVADVIGIEGSRRSTTYAWDPLTGSERFERVTLFEDRAVETVSNPEVAAALLAALDRHDPDIVVVGGWSHVEALTMIAWARRHRRPVVMMSESTADDHARSWPREWLKRRIVRLADAALVGGEPQAEYIAQLGVPRARVFLGYDAVDNGFFARGAEAARATPGLRAQLGLPERYFFASARFIEKKNFPRLLRAFAAYRAEHGDAAWDLVIAGDGELRGQIETLIAQLELGAAVRLVGFQQYDALPHYYGLASAFLHLSTSEQWGLVVNEAMAAGLPVIVSRQCGCSRDLVADGVNGWRVDAESELEIATRMGDLMTADTEAMAAAGREIVGRYGPARFASGLSAALAAASGRPRRSAGPIDRLLLRLLARRDTSVG